MYTPVWYDFAHIVTTVLPFFSGKVGYTRSLYNTYKHDIHGRCANPSIRVLLFCEKAPSGKDVVRYTGKHVLKSVYIITQVCSCILDVTRSPHHTLFVGLTYTKKKHLSFQ